MCCLLSMDDDFKRMLAPRRNKRHGDLPLFDEICSWAEKLDWKYNDAHFIALAKRVVESTDDELREKRGMRIDQVANWDELLRAMRHAASWFSSKHHRMIGIFIHLRLYVVNYIDDKLAAREGQTRKLPRYEISATDWLRATAGGRG